MKTFKCGCNGIPVAVGSGQRASFGACPHVIVGTKACGTPDTACEHQEPAEDQSDREATDRAARGVSLLHIQFTGGTGHNRRFGALNNVTSRFILNEVPNPPEEYIGGIVVAVFLEEGKQASKDGSNIYLYSRVENEWINIRSVRDLAHDVLFFKDIETAKGKIFGNLITVPVPISYSPELDGKRGVIKSFFQLTSEENGNLVLEHRGSVFAEAQEGKQA